MRVSYAQRLEDYHLAMVFRDVGIGTYVDVGGGHPVADNVSFHFYLKGWRGLIVEPQHMLSTLYKDIRPRDVLVDHLVGRADGEVDFHVVDRLHGFSTMIESHAKGAREFGAGYSTDRRPVRRLSGLIREHGFDEVDFLKIDVEGAESDVLAGLDLVDHRPKVLCIEAVAPGSMLDASGEWEPGLLSQGYDFVFFDGLNRFYVAREHASLADRFPRDPADWGVVTHLYEFGRADQNRDHPDHALAKRLIHGFLATIPSLGETELLAYLERSAPGGQLEDRDALRSLFYGKADFPGRMSDARNVLLDDRARAALGRIAAQFDGGMIGDEE